MIKKYEGVNRIDEDDIKTVISLYRYAIFLDFSGISYNIIRLNKLAVPHYFT